MVTEWVWNPFLPVKVSLAIGTMLHFDGDCGGDGRGAGTCKHTLMISNT